MLPEMQTVSGWVSFENGRLTPEFDLNFVVYPEPGLGKGINCKIRMYALLHSEVGMYPERGGVCRVIARGELQSAQRWEEGWSHGTLQYIRVSWVQLDIDDNAQFKDDAKKDLQTFFSHHQRRGNCGEEDIEETEDEEEEEGSDNPDYEEEEDYNKYNQEMHVARKKKANTSAAVNEPKNFAQQTGSNPGTSIAVAAAASVTTASKRSSDENDAPNAKKQKTMK